METLDTSVNARKERLIAADRVALLLQGLVDPDARRAADASGHLAALQTEVDAVNTRLTCVHRSIEGGIVVANGVLRQRSLLASRR